MISPTWIVTAGHCLHNVYGNRGAGATRYPMTATPNTANLATSAGEERSVVEVRQSGADDIALARLSAPVTDVRPLALPTGAATSSVDVIVPWIRTVVRDLPVR